ncbi:unnamed protein product, partial [Owenia fusiformis]
MYITQKGPLIEAKTTLRPKRAWICHRIMHQSNASQYKMSESYFAMCPDFNTFKDISVLYFKIISKLNTSVQKYSPYNSFSSQHPCLFSRREININVKKLKTFMTQNCYISIHYAF